MNRANPTFHRLFSVMIFAGCITRADPEVLTESLPLAVELSRDGFHQESAIEFRRLGLSDKPMAERAAYQWAAAWEYTQTGEYGSAEGMLDRADRQDDTYRAESLLLRSDVAEGQYDEETALFFLDSIPISSVSDEFRRYTGRRKAALHLQNGQPEQALLTLNDEAARNAVENYMAGRDKSPSLGGWLGLVPGLGYAYSGEYANAVRSLILNSLFIYGMVDTAQDEEWGAFTVITFFEITWYTGSIYGGVDSAHRYNQNRLDQALDGILGQADYQPDYSAFPSLKLEFRF